MAFDAVHDFLFERLAFTGDAEGAVIHVATGAAGDLPDLRRRQGAKTAAIEFLGAGKGDVIDIHVEAHADGVGGDQEIDIARLVERDLGIAGARRKRAPAMPRTALYQSGRCRFSRRHRCHRHGTQHGCRSRGLCGAGKIRRLCGAPAETRGDRRDCGRAGRGTRITTRFGVTVGCRSLRCGNRDARSRSHRYDPVKVLQWRNSDLDFQSLEAVGKPRTPRRRRGDLSRRARLLPDTHRLFSFEGDRRFGAIGKRDPRR